MDIVPLLFLLGIVVSSGVIALVADNLGRKLGKKRLWLKLPFLHLRPKHTAQAGVFLSGVTVSLLTILLVAGLSSDVRAWIMQGRKALADLTVAQGEVDDLKREGDKLGKEKNRLENQVRMGTRKVHEQEKTLAEQRTRIAEGESKIRGLEAKLSTGSAKIKALDGRLAAKDAEYRAAQSKLQAAESALSKGRLALAKIQTDLKKAKGNVKLAVGEYNKLLARNTEVENQNRVLEKSVSDLRADSVRLKSDLETLTSERERVSVELSQKVEELQDLQTRLTDANEAYRQLQAQALQESQLYGQIGDTFINSRKGRLIYRFGEEVARATVPANATEEQAKKALVELLSLSRTAATDRGAKAKGDYDAADIVSHYDSGLDRTLSPEDIRESLIRQVEGKDEPQVIVGTSSLNAFEGEPVSLEVSIFPNPLVYRQGQIVAEAKVDGKKEMNEILRQVQGQLAEKLNERLRKDRMIPRVGDANAYGTLGQDEVIDIVDRVRKADRKVTLRAIAEVDTRAGDPLRLRFGIR